MLRIDAVENSSRATRSVSTRVLPDPALADSQDRGAGIGGVDLPAQACGMKGHARSSGTGSSERSHSP
jgi:hypothetical protein